MAALTMSMSATPMPASLSTDCEVPSPAGVVTWNSRVSSSVWASSTSVTTTSCEASGLSAMAMEVPTSPAP